MKTEQYKSKKKKSIYYYTDGLFSCFMASKPRFQKN